MTGSQSLTKCGDTSSSILWSPLESLPIEADRDVAAHKVRHRMQLTFNPPPGWPTPPVGWSPPPDWTPDPSWPAAPAGWEFWVPVGDAQRQPQFASVAAATHAPPLAQPGVPGVLGSPTPAAPGRRRSLLIPLSIAAIVLPLVIITALMAGSGTSTPARTASSASPPAVTTRTPEPVLQFEKVNDRDFSDIAANPDRYRGKALIVYGAVIQFDTATGDNSLRAQVGGERVQGSASYSGTYPHNAFLRGEKLTSAGLVAQDVFEAKVVVTGSYTYPSITGAKITVPDFTVHAISVIGGENAKPLLGKRGETLMLGDIGFNVTSAEERAVLKPRYGETLKGRFIVIGLEIQNKTKTPFTIGWSNLALVENDGSTYKTLDSSYLYATEDESLIIETINPKATRNCKVFFELPPGAAISAFSLGVTDGSQKGLIAVGG